MKTTYRAYVQDTFVTGLMPQEVLVKTHPLPTEPALNPLTKLPEATLFPEVFVSGSRRQQNISTYGTKNTTHKEEWINWRDNLAPQSDDADAYVAEKGLWIPFKMYCLKTVQEMKRVQMLLLPHKNLVVLRAITDPCV